jgi:hypothetical protein
MVNLCRCAIAVTYTSAAFIDIKILSLPIRFHVSFVLISCGLTDAFHARYYIRLDFRKRIMLLNSTSIEFEP